jgi:hypothetical protein
MRSPRGNAPRLRGACRQAGPHATADPEAGQRPGTGQPSPGRHQPDTAGDAVNRDQDTQARRTTSRPPVYLIVVAASDWVKNTSRPIGPISRTPCAPAMTLTTTPNPTWKPNHDRQPGVTAMTLTINDTTMTSDLSAHTVRRSPDRNGWEVSWLPGRLMDRNASITAMVLADAAGTGQLHAGHHLWPHVQGWAAQLDLTAHEVLTRSSRPPAFITTGKDDAQPADPEAAS